MITVALDFLFSIFYNRISKIEKNVKKFPNLQIFMFSEIGADNPEVSNRGRPRIRLKLRIFAWMKGFRKAEIIREWWAEIRFKIWIFWKFRSLISWKFRQTMVPVCEIGQFCADIFLSHNFLTTWIRPWPSFGRSRSGKPWLKDEWAQSTKPS